jgi:hypothetical protein
MKRIGSVLGLVALVVVMAIVLLLVARSWESVAPVADELAPSPRATTGGERPGTSRSEELPGLDEMRDASGEHADRFQEALAATE